MDLSKMIIPDKAVWVEYPGLPGLEIELAHLTKDALMKIREKAVNKKLNRSTRKMEDEVDSDLFQSLYISAVIKNWKGFKLKYLNKFVPTDLNGQTEDEELDYTQENAEALMKNAMDFDNWVSDTIEDVELFTKSS